MTPSSQSPRSGAHNSAPTSTSEPRGSLTMAERNPSKLSRKIRARSASGPAPRSGPPSTTRRVGSPAVCESMTWIKFMVESYTVADPAGKE
jgi:hypothetical protein